MWFLAWHTERNNLQIHLLEKLHIKLLKLRRQGLALLQTEEGNLDSNGKWDDDDELEQSILPTSMPTYIDKTVTPPMYHI
jgi:hypothetical protein